MGKVVSSLTGLGKCARGQIKGRLRGALPSASALGYYQGDNQGSNGDARSPAINGWAIFGRRYATQTIRDTDFRGLKPTVTVRSLATRGKVGAMTCDA